jgi:hypothetical protein
MNQLIDIVFVYDDLQALMDYNQPLKCKASFLLYDYSNNNWAELLEQTSLPDNCLFVSGENKTMLHTVNFQFIPFFMSPFDVRKDYEEYIVKSVEEYCKELIKLIEKG